MARDGARWRAMARDGAIFKMSKNQGISISREILINAESRVAKVYVAPSMVIPSRPLGKSSGLRGEMAM
jgi:hypothetical protein